MIDLESEMPFVHWTLDGFNVKGSRQTVERAVWHHSPILSYTIADSWVTFDAPPEWGERALPVRLQETSGGNYEYRSQRAWFKSVRAETQTDIIMTGLWSTFRADVGGVFIAVLPVQQSQIGLERMEQAIPVGTYA